MRSMVEGLFKPEEAPPPAYGWSPSPANAGEDLIQGLQTGMSLGSGRAPRASNWAK